MDVEDWIYVSLAVFVHVSTQDMYTPIFRDL